MNPTISSYLILWSILGPCACVLFYKAGKMKGWAQGKAEGWLEYYEKEAAKSAARNRSRERDADGKFSPKNETQKTS